MRRYSAILAIILVASPVMADFHEDSISIHETTTAQFSNVKFHFILTINVPSRTTYEGDCWMNAGAMFINSSKNGKESIQYTINNTETRYIARLRNIKTGKFVINACRFAPGRLGVEIAPWAEAKLLFPTKNACGYYPLRSLLQESYDRIVDVAGVPTSVSRSGRTRLELDPKHGNLVRSLITTISRNNAQQVISSTVQDFYEIAPGVYFPKRAQTTESFDAVVKAERIIEISKVELNPNGFPSLEYKEKTKMVDLIDGTEYFIDPTGKVTDIKPFVPVISLKNPDGSVGHPTLYESRNPIFWLIPAGLSLVSASAAIWSYRRYRTHV